MKNNPASPKSQIQNSMTSVSPEQRWPGFLFFKAGGYMSIGKRLHLGFLAVCSLILIVGLLGLILSMQIRGLRNVELPMEQNLREVEVSIWETIHAADAFRLTGMPYYEELYRKQLGDVNEFFPRYEALIDTEEEKAYIREFNALWNEAKTAGDKMIVSAKAEKEQRRLLLEAVDVFSFSADMSDTFRFINSSLVYPKRLNVLWFASSNCCVSPSNIITALFSLSNRLL